MFNLNKRGHPVGHLPSMFPRRTDCTLSILRLIRSSLNTNAFAVSETVSWPISQLNELLLLHLIEMLLAALETRLRISQSFAFLLYPRSLPWGTLTISDKR